MIYYINNIMAVRQDNQGVTNALGILDTTHTLQMLGNELYKDSEVFHLRKNFSWQIEVLVASWSSRQNLFDQKYTQESDTPVPIKE